VGKVRRIFALLSAGIFLCALVALAQDDSPSLGDVARQTRLRKQKDAQAASSQISQKPNPQNSLEDSAGATAPNSDGQNLAPMPATAAAQTANGSGNSQAKNEPSKPKHVITNEEFPEAIRPSASPTPTAHSDDTSASQSQEGEQKLSAEQWKSQIQAIKANIATLQKEIDDLSASIQYAPANCVSGCVEWNEHQQQKQQQVDTLKAQLADQQKTLEDMQESARRQGYGSSVYDP
jgi:hypothetical protein